MFNIIDFVSFPRGLVLAAALDEEYVLRIFFATSKGCFFSDFFFFFFFFLLLLLLLLLLFQYNTSTHIIYS